MTLDNLLEVIKVIKNSDYLEQSSISRSFYEYLETKMPYEIEVFSSRRGCLKIIDSKPIFNQAIIFKPSEKSLHKIDRSTSDAGYDIWHSLE